VAGRPRIKLEVAGDRSAVRTEMSPSLGVVRGRCITHVSHGNLGLNAVRKECHRCGNGRNKQAHRPSSSSISGFPSKPWYGVLCQSVRMIPYTGN